MNLTSDQTEAIHALDEVRSLLRRYLARTDRLDPAAAALDRGVIGPAEIRAFLDRTDRGRPSLDTDGPQWRAETGPAAALRRHFGLDEFELGVLWTLFAAATREDFLRAMSFAWDDYSTKSPTVGFLVDLLESDWIRAVSRVNQLSGNATLLRYGLVETDQGATVGSGGPRSAALRLAPRLAAYLVGQSASLDPALQGLATWHVDSGPAVEIIGEPKSNEAIRRGLEEWIGAGSASVVALQGPPGIGKSTWVRAVASQSGRTVVEAHLSRLSERPTTAAPALSELRREAALLGAVLHVDLAECDADWLRLAPVSQALAELIRDPVVPVSLGALHPLELDVMGPARIRVFPVPSPGVPERTALWTRFSAKLGSRMAEEAADELARRYPLPAGGVSRACQRAAALAESRPAARRSLEPDDWILAARAELDDRMSRLATRVEAGFTWEDLILPEDSVRALREISAFAHHRQTVFEEWGFGKKLPYGRGLSALFHGPPGTGKTMAASVIASELGLELFRVDLGQIVSKYVGETEKNLARIFDEAIRHRTILLFDEADALFAKRTDVKSATDRYANLEVNYLLQRMEEYEGVTILTTNLEDGIDQAFKRRLRFRVYFPMPEVESRVELWKSMIPDPARVEQGVDWEYLAEEMPIAGGPIKNAVVRAAFWAAERGGQITYDDLCQAGFRECRELGILVREHGF